MKSKDSPIFILGCGHTGTTLLHRILSCHPNLYGIPFESHVLREEKSVRQERYQEWMATAESEGDSRWIEKTPRHVRFLSTLREDFPDAKIVVCFRDSRDVAVSLRERYARDRKLTGMLAPIEKISWAKNLYLFRKGLWRYVNDTKLSLEALELPNSYRFDYEDLVSDTEKSLKGLCDFIEEPFDEILLHFHEAENRFGPGSNEQSQLRNKQINSALYDGRGKWKKKMTGTEKYIFKLSEANRQLVELDYESSPNW